MHIDTNKTVAGRWPSGSLAEYLLVGHPDAGVDTKVMEEMQLFSAAYGEKMAVKTRPQMTIASFLANEGMEATLVKWLQRICGAQQRFNVTLNNYSGFPPHTIYLRVQDPQPFQQLARQLKSVDDFIRAPACPPARLMTKPHLCLAGKLDEAVYNKAIIEYAQKTFHESFMMDELLLMKRQQQFDSCKIIHIFRLRPAGSEHCSSVA